jgi:MFS family permease
MAAEARPARPVTDRGERPRLTRALRSRNFRLFFGGQSVSLVGTWITRIATSWLVYRLTGSALLLGLVGFCGQIPTLLLAPFVGVLVDRMDRHRILLVTQVLSLLQSATLAVLTLSGRISVMDILVLQVVQGIINAFDTPARQAFVVEMVADRDDLPNAIALNSTMVNASRIIGPSIGGIIIAAVGEGWCFTLDAVSYVAVILSLMAMRLTARALPARDTRMREELRTGFEYVWRFLPIRWALLLLSLVSIMGMPYSVLMPAISTTVLHGGPHTLGFLMTASGAGALVGALYLASRRSILGLERAMVIASGCFGLGLIALSFSTVLWISLAVLPLVGAGMMVTMAAANTIIQTVVTEQLRGRVMAFYTMAFLGSAPIGSLLAGVAAEQIGAPRTILLGGVACIAAAGWFGSRLPRILAAAESDAQVKSL